MGLIREKGDRNDEKKKKVRQSEGAKMSWKRYSNRTPWCQGKVEL